MSNNVTLSLPLSATALRLGATLLTDLAAQTETIYAELTGMNPFYRSATTGSDQLDVIVEGLKHSDGLGGVQEIQPEQYGVAETTLEQDVETAEAATGITQETLPPVEYETVVTGYEPGPTPYADGHDQASYERAGWDIPALLAAGHLVEVTEQRVKVVAPGASAAPSAPAPAPAPAANGVQLDKDGLPWDSRIHSDAAEKLTKTGVWKTRKNLPDGYKAQIETELKAVMNAGKSPAAAPTPTPSGSTSVSATTPAAPAADPNAAATAPAPVTVTTATAAPTPAPSPAPAPSAAPAPAPSPAPAPAATAAAAGNPFADFTRWLVTHTKAGKLSQTDAVLEIQKQGLSSIPDLAKRPDLIPAVIAALSAAKGL